MLEVMGARSHAHHRVAPKPLSALNQEENIMPNDEIEKLSAKLHVIYQEEAKRQADVRHEDIYEDLQENAKEFFRAQARYILDHYVKR
jgi:hypothetical protein